TNRRRSSITEVSFHGINTSRQKAKSVTHVSGTKRHLSLKSGIEFAYLNSDRISGLMESFPKRYAVIDTRRTDGLRYLPS
ncbi:hypothetical protein, partial [Rhizobium bangladeshense]|uniref:hypothetical protein n=1 Tax=Rhizobium bangladeshense TaxID=1138189 RepID=UPI001C90AEB2